MTPNDYELGYDEGYQDGRVACETVDTVERLRAQRDEWKARAEKAERQLKYIRENCTLDFEEHDALKEQGQ